MAVELPPFVADIGRSRRQRVAMCVAVLLVALPLAFSELHAEGGLLGGSITHSWSFFTYGWPWPCVELSENEFTLLAKPPVRTYTWHVGWLIADALTCAGVLAGSAWAAHRILSRGRPQFTLRGALLTTTAIAIWLALESESIGEIFADPVDGNELAQYLLIQIPVLVGVICFFAFAVAALGGFAGWCRRRATVAMQLKRHSPAI